MRRDLGESRAAMIWNDWRDGKYRFPSGSQGSDPHNEACQVAVAENRPMSVIPTAEEAASHWAGVEALCASYGYGQGRYCGD